MLVAEQQPPRGQAGRCEEPRCVPEARSRGRWARLNAGSSKVAKMNSRLVSFLGAFLGLTGLLNCAHARASPRQVRRGGSEGARVGPGGARVWGREVCVARSSVVA